MAPSTRSIRTAESFLEAFPNSRVMLLTHSRNVLKLERNLIQTPWWALA
jgi:hypothetical protein